MALTRAVAAASMMVVFAGAARVLDSQSALQAAGGDRRAGGDKRCTIRGPAGEEASFPVNRCVLECVKIATWHGKTGADMQTTKRFSEAFTTAVKGKRCECSVEANPLVQFPVFTDGQKDDCKGNTDDAKLTCWEVYKQGRSTRVQLMTTSQGKKIAIAERHPEIYSESAFVVDRACQACDGDACTVPTHLPSVISGLQPEVKQALVEDLQAGDTDGHANQVLKDFQAILVDADVDRLFFDILDMDSNNYLDIGELVDGFPGFTREVLVGFVRDAVGAESFNEDVHIRFEDFQLVRDSMRNWTAAQQPPTVDEEGPVLQSQPVVSEEPPSGSVSVEPVGLAEPVSQSGPVAVGGQPVAVEIEDPAAGEEWGFRGFFETDFVGITPRQRETVKVMLKSGAPILGKSDLNNKVCSLMTIGSYKACTAVTPANGGAHTCRCSFVGAKPMTCERIFGEGEKAAYPVSTANGEVAIFVKDLCTCRGDTATWPNSECDFSVSA